MIVPDTDLIQMLMSIEFMVSVSVRVHADIVGFIKFEVVVETGIYLKLDNRLDNK